MNKTVTFYVHYLTNLGYLQNVNTFDVYGMRTPETRVTISPFFIESSQLTVEPQAGEVHTVSSAMGARSCMYTNPSLLVSVGTTLAFIPETYLFAMEAGFPNYISATIGLDSTATCYGMVE